jgi:hypothetical protein
LRNSVRVFDRPNSRVGVDGPTYDAVSKTTAPAVESRGDPSGARW